MTVWPIDFSFVVELRVAETIRELVQMGRAAGMAVTSSLQKVG
jgi:hypothetical protein